MESMRQFRYCRPVGASPVHPALRSPMQCIKRFDGREKAATVWDSLRRDEELWHNDGDCMVHFYNHGSSRRGPSLRISVVELETCKSQYLLNRCLVPCDRPSSPAGEDSSSDSGYSTSRTSDGIEAYHHLYVPAPADLSREDTHAYHIGTRNYFAFLLGKPLVGEELGTALVNLWDRIQLWQPYNADAVVMLTYCQEQGYLDFAENPTYALAGLQLSEEAGFSETWLDAFVHCVGMRNRLEDSSEKRNISNITYSLITRASLEMELHVSRVTQALGEFLEEELGPDNFGLSRPARDHLDRFRSTLHSFYVEKFGYYPPDLSDDWSKTTWFSMYDDFQNLYAYLADVESSHDLSRNRSNSLGGICVIQNVQAFNSRHDFSQLPYPHPLLPDLPARKRTSESQVSLKSFRLRRTGSNVGATVEDETTLEQATNPDLPEILDNLLVQEYIRFERLQLDEKVSVLEARKVRWMLVYGMLQMLISITRAPKGVKDVYSPSYPLCVSATTAPSWVKTRAQQRRLERTTPDLRSSRSFVDEDRISIYPDCEADSAEEYFSKSRSNSDQSDSMAPAPLRTAPQPSRAASFRSSVHSSVNSLHRSVVGGLTRRNSSRRSSFLPSLSRGNSLIMTVPEAEVLETASMESSRPESVASSYDTHAEPTLEGHQLETSDESRSISPIDSCNSSTSQQDDDSSSRSSMLESCDSPTSDVSSLDDESDHTPPTPPKMHSNPTFEFGFHNYQSFQPYDYRHDESLLSVRSKNVSAGCYTPSGADFKIPSRVSSLRFRTATTASDGASPSLLTVPQVLRSESFSSVASDGSSIYPETSLQAAEIEEEETRGRRRIRGLERLPVTFGKVDANFFEGITELR